MSETISDSTEPKRSDAPYSCVWCAMHGMGDVYRFMTLPDTITCLIAARSRVDVQRIAALAVPQIDWGGREVSPYYRM